MFEVLDKMEVEEIMNKDSSDEEVLSDDTGCANDMNEYEMDSVEKFVSSLEVHMLNARIKRDPQLVYNRWCFNHLYIMHDSYSYGKPIVPMIHAAML